MGEMISGIEENALKYALDIIWHQINLRKLAYLMHIMGTSPLLEEDLQLEDRDTRLVSSLFFFCW